MNTCYVVLRREPQGEVVNTLIMGVTDSAADAEEYIFTLAEDYAYYNFCLVMNERENTSFEEASEYGNSAMSYFMDNCNILKTYKI